jgi:hypothetical protein
MSRQTPIAVSFLIRPRRVRAAWQTALLLGNSNVNRDTKIPRPPHLLDLGAAAHADVVLSSARSSAWPFFSLVAAVAAAAVVEEKTNGANMAFPLLPIGYSLSSSSISCRAFSSARCAALSTDNDLQQQQQQQQPHCITAETASTS